MSAGLHRTFASLSIPNYRRYFVGQVISVSGNWMQLVAQMWLIVQLTGSGVAVGLTAACSSRPSSCSAPGVASWPTASPSGAC